MKFVVFEQIINQLALAKFRGYLAYHFFNEPLLNSELEKFVKYPLSELV